MKKQYRCFCAVLLCIFCLTGCGNVHTSITYTFSVSTGDSVDIKFDTTGDYQITSDLPFEISQDGTLLTSGSFISSDGYQMYVDVVNADDDAEIIESSSTDTLEYIMWNYNDTEFNYAILIKDSQTGVLLGNQTSEESAREVFNRLEISLH